MEQAQRIGKKLSGDEVKAGLDALCGDGGVEGALAAMERCFRADTKVRVGQWIFPSYWPKVSIAVGVEIINNYAKK